MATPYPDESELLKTILKPLLDDFTYWFDQAYDRLSHQRIPFLSEDEQSDLLSRVTVARQEVYSAKLLYMATGQQVGIEMKALMPWHSLVLECWQVATRLRSLTQPEEIPGSLPVAPTLGQRDA